MAGVEELEMARACRADGYASNYCDGLGRDRFLFCPCVRYIDLQGLALGDARFYFKAVDLGWAWRSMKTS